LPSSSVGTPVADPTPAEIERVVLLGFMASGKTAVGAALARRLGWEHIDLDTEIERREGLPIAEIFVKRGEAHFRWLEAAATERIASAREVVLSPGGGWITNPKLLGRLGSRTLSVWLQVSPEEILRRLESAGEVERRPLLRAPDPADTVRRMLRDREPLYRLAEVAVSTDGRDVEDIAEGIELLVRNRLAVPLGI
jgi:shikimate kinase